MTGKLKKISSLTAQGWVRSVRHSKAGLSFIGLNDGTQPQDLQVVAFAEQLPNYAEVQRLSAGCAIQVTGILVPSEGEGQAFELKAESLSVLGWVEAPDHYPLAKKKHSMEHLRSHPHLRPRSRTFQALAHLRHQLALATHRFFEQEGYLWLASPILTHSDCEGAGEAFEVVSQASAEKHQHFFGKAAYLTVSGQLHGEAYACALSKIYTFGPTFRAENSNTSRHLSEFWMLEPEVAFLDLEGIIDLAEKLLVHLAQHLLQKAYPWIERLSELHAEKLEARLQALAQGQYPRITYDEAIRVLGKAPVFFENPVHWGVDLKAEHERYLAETYAQGPIFITHYPSELKAFYMREEEGGRTVAAFDLLLPKWGELMGGSQREERLDVLLNKMKRAQIELEDLQWYLDLRRYGSVPHSGFGVGFERLVAYMGGISNIRDAIPFPRAPKWMDA